MYFKTNINTTALLISYCYSHLLTIGLDRIVQLDTTTREPIDDFGLYDGQKVSCLNYSLSGKLLAFATSEGHIYCRSFPEDEAQAKSEPIQGCSKRPINCLVFRSFPDVILCAYLIILYKICLAQFFSKKYAALCLSYCPKVCLSDCPSVSLNQILMNSLIKVKFI